MGKEDKEYTWNLLAKKLTGEASPEELQELALNQETRRTLLQAYQAFYALHVADFGEMKTLTVLQTVLS